MSMLCWLLAGGCLVYFAFVRRKIDLLSFGYAGFSVYSMPILIGSVPAYVSTERLEIVNFLYVYYIVFLLAFLCTTLVYDKYFGKVEPSKQWSFHIPKYLVLSLFGLAVVMVLSLSGYLLSSGIYIQHGVEKSQVLHELPPIYNWVVYYLIASAIFCASLRYYWLSFFIILLFAFDIAFIGMRVHFILALIGVMLAVLNGYKLTLKQALFGVISSTALIAIVIFIKPMVRIFSSTEHPVAELIHYFNGSARFTRYLGSMEPFPQISIFNEVVKHSVHIPFNEWWQGIITLFGFGDTSLVVKFTSVISELFPGIREGALGSSSVAEIYALLGVAGLTAFCLLYPSLLAFLSYLCRKYGDIAKLTFLPVIPIVGFYFYRSDIYFSLLQMRRILFYSLILLSITLLIKIIKRKSV
ncbi:hypothetical protein P4S70_05035 [Enterovibrio sp. Hal110]